MAVWTACQFLSGLPARPAIALPLLAAAIASAGAAAKPAAVTFHKNIAPILLAQCAPCHRPGEAGPFALLTYDDARKHASQIAEVTRKRYMPPWLPAPGFGDFAGERRLTDAQIATIEQWVRAGSSRRLGRGVAAAPCLHARLATRSTRPRHHRGKPFSRARGRPGHFLEFHPFRGGARNAPGEGDRDSPGQHPRRASRQSADRPLAILHDIVRRLPGEGFAGMDIAIASDTFDPDSHFLFWKPGATPWKEPAGMSWRLDPGNDLILNVHLRPTGKPELIQPSVGFYFTREPQTKYPMLLQLEHDGALDIPPGDREFLVSDDFRLPVDVDLLAVYPHAHYLGKLLEGFATLPDGARQWLIRIPDWDLNWQAVYRYREPLFLPKGTVISMRFQYDNSTANPRNPNSPPKRVRGGNQSTDEMAHLWLQVLPRGPGEQRGALQEAIMNRRLEKYPADFSAHFNLGALLLDRHDIPSATAHLAAALHVEPEQPAALNAFGVALESDGKFDEAIEQFRHALRVGPEDSSARYNLANTFAAQGRLEDAAAGFRELLAAHPEVDAAHQHLVQILMELGDSAASSGRTPQAIERYRELVALEPGNADLRNNFGILLARSGDMPSALAQFEAALKADPSHAAARRNLELTRKKMQH